MNAAAAGIPLNISRQTDEPALTSTAAGPRGRRLARQSAPQPAPEEST